MPVLRQQYVESQTVTTTSSIWTTAYYSGDCHSGLRRRHVINALYDDFYASVAFNVPSIAA